MVRPHYVTKRVGEDYVLVRVDPVGHAGRWITGALGTMLLARGIRRVGLFSMLTCAAGAACMYHALSGRSPMDLVCDSKGTAQQGEAKDSPSFPGEAVSKQVPSDEVDEASMESFPASDPPAHRRSVAVG